VILRSLALAVALVAGLSGCKSPGEITTGGSVEKKVSAREWMTTLCTAVDDWEKPVADVPQTGDNKNLAEMKPIVSDFLGSLSTATNEIVEKMDDAGVPDIDNGEKAASDFNKALRQMKTAIDGARSKVEVIPDKDPAKYPDGLVQLGTVLQTDVLASIQSIAQAVQTLVTTYPELSEAAKKVPACSSSAQ
jgi:hypothetical protein